MEKENNFYFGKHMLASKNDDTDVDDNDNIPLEVLNQMDMEKQRQYINTKDKENNKH